VLLIERFDRVPTENGWQRKAMVSALTLLGLDELMARYASYEDLAEIIRHRFRDASATLKELFSRLVFNILCGNNDDHARNHAAFWDGEMLSLTPAYDICPQSRAGNETSQAMLISGNNRMSKITSCIEAAHHFLLSPDDALEIMAQQKKIIENNWASVCDEAELNQTDRNLFWNRQFLNPYAFEGLKE
jgi:serine/threonine-protein kinase HipA